MLVDVACPRTALVANDHARGGRMVHVLALDELLLRSAHFQEIDVGAKVAMLCVMQLLPWSFGTRQCVICLLGRKSRYVQAQR